MLRYAIRRVIASIPVLVVASILVFVIVHELGADPARLRCEHSRDSTCVARVRASLGLNRSLPTQYVDEMGDFVTGDWGESLRSDRSVSAAIGDALGETAQLVGWAVLLSAGFALVLGVYGASRAGSTRDTVIAGFAFVGVAIPTFWLGLLAIQFLTNGLRDVLGTSEPIVFSIPDPTGSGLVHYVRELALPVLVLCVPLIATWSRYQRAATLEELDRDYVRVARAKGLSSRRAVWVHAVRNSLGPFVNVVALDLGLLLGGVIVTERVFSRPGMGTLLLDALLNGDTQVVLPWMLVSGVFVVGCNLLADLLHAALDPRVRLG